MSRIEDEALLLLDLTDIECQEALKTELSDIKELDKELAKVENKLYKLAEKLARLDESDNPDLDEVHSLYLEYLDLSSRQSTLTDAISLGIETIGLLEDTLY